MDYEKEKQKVYFEIRHNSKRKYFVPVTATDIVTGREINFECVKDAERTLNVDRRHIYKVIDGKRKTAGGYYWRRTEV